MVLWEPMHGHQSRARPTLTYLDVLKKDAGAQSTNRCMENRDDLKGRWRARLRTTFLDRMVDLCFLFIVGKQLKNVLKYGFLSFYEDRIIFRSHTTIRDIRIRPSEARP